MTRLAYSIMMRSSILQLKFPWKRRTMSSWNSRRSTVFATNGMVASSQPLASEAGISILRKGGNAADAAVGVAAVLNVIQPTSTGLGGDMFCLYYDSQKKTVQAINGSGRCSSELTLDVLQDLGYNEKNRPINTSPLWITVPGTAAGWIDTIERFGSGQLHLQDILQPATFLAENGYPVGEWTSRAWKQSENLLQSTLNGEEMLKNGKAPKEAETMKLPGLAKVFRTLAKEGKKGFYEGPIAEAVVKVVTESGGKMSLEDLRSHTSTFEDPIQTNYRGIDVYECAPNGQGITALVALNILEGFEIGSLQPNSPEHLHLIIEALRLAFADSRYYVTDPKFYDVPTNGLLSKDYAKKRRELISQSKALKDIEHGYPEHGSNTVYFCVVDGSGNACSFINSNYEGFGTGIIPKGYGFTLQNRGDGFSLDPNHPNRLHPKKRPYHTIIPGMALRNGELWAAFGVMGGFMQPPGHVQVLSNLIDFKMSPQEALDASRFRISDGTSSGEIELEDGISEATRDMLIELGHRIKSNPKFVTNWDRYIFGTGQIIRRNPIDGVLSAGSDPRNDGMAIGW